MTEQLVRSPDTRCSVVVREIIRGVPHRFLGPVGERGQKVSQEPTIRIVELMMRLIHGLFTRFLDLIPGPDRVAGIRVDVVPTLFDGQEDVSAVMALMRHEIRERSEDSPLEAPSLWGSVEHVPEKRLDGRARGRQSFDQLVA